MCVSEPQTQANPIPALWSARGKRGVEGGTGDGQEYWLLAPEAICMDIAWFRLWLLPLIWFHRLQLAFLWLVLRSIHPGSGPWLNPIAHDALEIVEEIVEETS